VRWRRTFLEGTGRRERLDVIVVTLRICHAHMQSRALCSSGRRPKCTRELLQPRGSNGLIG